MVAVITQSSAVGAVMKVYLGSGDFTELQGIQELITTSGFDSN
jgi:hypothetical protein